MTAEQRRASATLYHSLSDGRAVPIQPDAHHSEVVLSEVTGRFPCLAARVASSLTAHTLPQVDLGRVAAHRSGSCWPQPSGRAACKRAPRCKWQWGALRSKPRGVGPLARTWCSRVLQKEALPRNRDLLPADPMAQPTGRGWRLSGPYWENVQPPRTVHHSMRSERARPLRVAHRQRCAIRYQLEVVAPGPTGASIDLLSELHTTSLPTCAVPFWVFPQFRRHGWLCDAHLTTSGRL